MSNLDRIYDLNLDLVYKVQNDEMEFSINDVNTSVFYVTFTRNRKEVLNLRGKSVVFYIVKPNGKAVYTNLQYDLDQERFYCDLTTGFKNLLGNYIGQIVVYDSETEERVVIPTQISFTVVSDILETSIGDVDEEEQMTILESLIKDISSWSGKIDEAVNKANESLNMVEGAKQIALTNQSDISNLEDEVSQIKEKYATKDYVNDIVDEIDVTGQLGDYATKDYVNDAIESVDVTDQLKDYAKKIDIPDKVSQLENDKGYLTEHQSLEGYATEDYVATEIAKAKLEGEEVDLSGYALKKDIPNKLSQLINDSGFLTSIPSEYITEIELNKAIESVDVTSQLGDYAKKTEIPTKVSQLTNDKNYLTSIPSEYVTETELNEAIESVDVTEQLEDYAKKTEIPTKVSQLENDKNYLTSIPSEYVTETELDSSLRELEKIETSNTEPTNSDVSIWINTSEDNPINIIPRISDNTTSNSTVWSSEKTKKYVDDIIDDVDVTEQLKDYVTESELTAKNYATQSYVSSEIAKAQLDSDGDIDLSGFATKDDIPTKTSQLTNDSGYLTSVPSEYITETELENKGYLTEHQSLTDYAKKSEIPTKVSQLTNDKNYLTSIPSEYITETELNQAIESVDVTSQLGDYAKKTDVPTKVSQLTNDKGYLTEHQSLTDYAKKSEVPTKVSQLTNDSGYLTSVPSEYIDETDLQTHTDQVLSAGEQLVLNGSQVLQNNYNFSQLTYDGTVANNSAGSLLGGVGKRQDIISDFFFTINPNKSIYASFDVKGAVGSRMYAFVDFYDVDKQRISASTVMYQPNTLTRLTQDLKQGDTVVHFEDLTNWREDLTATHQKSFIFWNWTNNKGYTYPPETYSRNTFQNIYADSSSVDKTNKTITLTTAWNKGTIPAGTYVSQGNNGNNYRYMKGSSLAVTTEWKTIDYVYEGVDNTGQNIQSKFPPATAFAKFGMFLNFNGVADEKVWVTNITVKEDLYSTQHTHDNKSVLDGITSNNITLWGRAYNHSTSTHAPSDAQKNSDITKAEIEAKLTGTITSHSHNYLTSIPSEYVTDSELTAKDYSTKSYVDNAISNADVVEVGNTEPTNTNIDLWLNPTDDEEIDIAVIDDNATSSSTVWSSAKTNEIISNIDVTEQLGNYATKDYVDDAIADVDVADQLVDYAKKTDIPSVPTNISAFTNDKGYLTSIPSEYVTDSELNAKGYLTQHQDLSAYAKTSQIPTKVSQLTNDSKYLTSVPSEYVTETELSTKGYLTNESLNYVTPQMFGAKANGVDDDTKAINDAIESVGNDGIVFFPEGTYKVSSSSSSSLDESHRYFAIRIYQKENLKLVLSPKAHIKHRLQTQQEITDGNQARYYTIGIMKSKNIQVLGGKIEGEADEHIATYKDNSSLFWWQTDGTYSRCQGHGISVRASENVLIQDCEIFNCFGDSVIVGTNSASEKSKNVTIERCNLHDSIRQGISVTGADNTIIRDCEIYNISGCSPQSGIDFEPNSVSEMNVGSLVDGCYIHDCLGSALIHSKANNGAKVKDCRLYGRVTTFDDDVYPVEYVNCDMLVYHSSSAYRNSLYNCKIASCLMYEIGDDFYDCIFNPHIIDGYGATVSNLIESGDSLLQNSQARFYRCQFITESNNTYSSVFRLWKNGGTLGYALFDGCTFILGKHSYQGLEIKVSKELEITRCMFITSSTSYSTQFIELTAPNRLTLKDNIFDVRALTSYSGYNSLLRLYTKDVIVEGCGFLATSQISTYPIAQTFISDVGEIYILRNCMPMWDNTGLLASSTAYKFVTSDNVTSIIENTEVQEQLEQLEVELKAYTDVRVNDLTAQGMQQTPLFASRIEDCTDTSKVYVLPDGNIYGCITTWDEGGKPLFKDWLPLSIKSDGSLYNEGVGYTANTKLASDGTQAEVSGCFSTGFIPVKPNDVVRFTNITKGASNGLFQYNSSFTKVGSTYYWDNLTDEGNGVYSKVIQNLNTIAYIRLCTGISSETKISINEPITYTEPSSVSEWKDTGHAFVVNLNGEDFATKTYMNNQLSNYAKTTDLHSHSNKSVLDGVTSTNVSNWGSAYNHSTSTHAPSNAQKNSDITKAEIESKLTGTITSHSHNYLSSVPSEYVTESELTAKGYATQSYVEEIVASANEEVIFDSATDTVLADYYTDFSGLMCYVGDVSININSSNNPYNVIIDDVVYEGKDSIYDSQNNAWYWDNNGSWLYIHNNYDGQNKLVVTWDDFYYSHLVVTKSVDNGGIITTFIGTSDSLATDSEKIITIDDPKFALRVGVIIAFRPSVSNSASNVKLNVNGTGAYPIWYSTSEYTSSSATPTGTANAYNFYMFDGTHWVWISRSNYVTYSPASLGFGYGVCSTAESTTAKAVTISSYTLTTGGIVAIKFTYGVPANATLNIRTRGAKKIFYNGSAITSGVIKAGDTVTLQYDGTQYQVINIERNYSSEIDALRNELLGEINNIATLLGGDA